MSIYNSRPNLVIGFHGCDLAVRDQLLLRPDEIKFSKESYDWLGHGFYVWENNDARAWQFAHEKLKRGKLHEPAVLGVVLQPNYCLDLTDSFFTSLLAISYEELVEEVRKSEAKMPVNRNVPNDVFQDLLLRDLDCAVIEHLHNLIDEGRMAKINSFDTVRGVFTEGGPAFPGAGIQAKTHVQICLRNTDCIKGFFLPRREME